MSNYTRIYTPGGTYFFTVVTHKRAPLFHHCGNADLLRTAMRYTMERRPFDMPAAVILPDHIHCIWVMTEDHDYSVRWQLIKTRFTRLFRKCNPDKKDWRLWQPRFWEHLIRDDSDLSRHLDYLHYNPVKHGFVERPLDWKYNSFGRYVEKGFYDADWGGGLPDSVSGIDLE